MPAIRFPIKLVNRFVGLALGLAWLTITAGCLPTSAGLGQKTDDSAVLRESFQTQLSQRGPSPQAGETLATPAGAMPVEYVSGGHKLQAYVDLDPGDGQQRPAVLFLHGGFAFGEGDWEMPQPFRDAGYVVMVPILRGENGQPGDFSLFYDEVADVLAAAEVLAQQPHVDPQRIYLAGHSAGGSLAALAAQASSRFRAAASLSGSLDMQNLAEMQPELIVFPPSLPELEMRSAVVYAASFKCPVRLYYGSDEGWAKDESDRAASFATAHGRDVEAIQVPGDHFSSVPPAIQQTINFFREH